MPIWARVASDWQTGQESVQDDWLLSDRVSDDSRGLPLLANPGSH